MATKAPGATRHDYRNSAGTPKTFTSYDRYALASLAILCGHALSARDADHLFSVTRLAVAVHRLRSGYWGEAVPVQTVNVTERSNPRPALGSLPITSAPVTFCRYACTVDKGTRDRIAVAMFPDLSNNERRMLVAMFADRRFSTIPRAEALTTKGGDHADN